MTKPEIRSYPAGTKSSGSVTSFLQRFGQSRQTGSVNVPCQGCTACCRSPLMRRELAPDELPRFPDAQLDTDLKTWVLPKKADGTCSRLFDGKCSIYNDRPFVCRMYDCRMALLIGMMPDNDPIMQEALEQWQPFLTSLPEDKDIAIAVRIAVAAGGMPTTSGEADVKASRWRSYLHDARKLRQAIEAMQPEERQRFLGTSAVTDVSDVPSIHRIWDLCVSARARVNV